MAWALQVLMTGVGGKVWGRVGGVYLVGVGGEGVYLPSLYPSELAVTHFQRHSGPSAHQISGFSRTPACKICFTLPCAAKCPSWRGKRRPDAAELSKPALNLPRAVIAVDGHKVRVLFWMLRAQTRTIALFRAAEASGRRVVRILHEIINVLFAHREKHHEWWLWIKQSLIPLELSRFLLRVIGVIIVVGSVVVVYSYSLKGIDPLVRLLENAAYWLRAAKWRIRVVALMLPSSNILIVLANHTRAALFVELCPPLLQMRPMKTSPPDRSTISCPGNRVASCSDSEWNFFFHQNSWI